MSFERRLKLWETERDTVIPQFDAAIKVLRSQLSEYEQQKAKFSDHIFTRIFTDRATAEMEMDDLLRNEAGDACGDGCLGMDKYTARCIVGETVWEATARVEYGRHDKRYYYVDFFTMTFEELGPYIEIYPE